MNGMAWPAVFWLGGLALIFMSALGQEDLSASQARLAGVWSLIVLGGWGVSRWWASRCANRCAKR